MGDFSKKKCVKYQVDFPQPLCSISCGDPNIIFWRGTGNLRIDDANVPSEFVEKIGNFVGIRARVVNVDYGCGL